MGDESVLEEAEAVLRAASAELVQIGYPVLVANSSPEGRTILMEIDKCLRFYGAEWSDFMDFDGLAWKISVVHFDWIFDALREYFLIEKGEK